MNQSISKAVAAAYEHRRDRAEKERLQNIDKIYLKYPEIEIIDREIASAGAALLFEAIDPERPRLAAIKKKELEKKRADFILAHNISADFDQPVFHCKACKDTGMEKQHLCSCYRQVMMPLLIEHANLKNLKNIKFDQFDESLFSDKVDVENNKSDVSPRKNISAIKNSVIKYAEAFAMKKTELIASEKLADNLLFMGKPGTGKTFLMACLANTFLEEGSMVFYVSAPELFEILNELRVLQSSFQPDPVRMEQVSALYDSILHADLLLIDDLGTENKGASRYSELLTLVDRRLAPGLHTVISSNADAGAIKASYDERLLSRLMGNYAIYRFFGDDIRLQLSRRRRGL